MPLHELTKYEINAWKSGVEYIAGVDEVGRGALAGPMVVSAVILNKKHIIEQDFSLRTLTKEYELYEKINDSKKVSDKVRRIISSFLHTELIDYSLVEVPHSDIDKLGISTCTERAFHSAINSLKIRPSHIFTDSFEIKMLAKESQTNLVRGDSLSISIAAASIIAKVYRDDLMIKLHDNNSNYQVYGFDKHKGYGTLAHRRAIKEHGLSDIHRKSYSINLNI